MADGLLKPRSASPTGSESSQSSYKSDSSRKRGRSADKTGDMKRPERNTRAKTSLNTVMDELRAISESLVKQSVILQDLPAIKTAIETISGDVNVLKVAIAQLETKNNSLTTTSERLIKENEDLRQSVRSLEARVDQLAVAATPGELNSTNLSKLTAAANANALCFQRGVSANRHNNEITISGLSFADVDQGVLISIVAAAARAIKADVTPEDFVSARPFRKKANPAIDVGSQSAAIISGPIRTTFAVVCKDHTVVSRMLYAKRTFGLLRLNQLDLENLRGDDTTAIFDGNPAININPLLPMYVLKLLRAAKVGLKEAGFKYVWCRNNTIFAKATDDSLVQIVNSAADIPRIVQLYSNCQQ